MYGRIPLSSAASSLHDSGRGQNSPADNSHQHNTKENADAVNTNIPQRRTAPGDERLVIFIGAGEPDAYNSGDQEQWESPEPIDIKGKGYSDGQNEIFGHMGQFSYGSLNSPGIGINLLAVQIFVQDTASGFNNFVTDLIT